jgi:hypothetical protein
MLAHFNNENSSFEKYVSKFNKLKKRGKTKILPLLLKNFLQTNPEGGWNFVLKLSNQDLTETQKRIIDSYNLLGDCCRRKMVEKMAYYLLMMDIDYEFVLSQTDDETMTQFILCDYSS